jgi:hypothetical protein
LAELPRVAAAIDGSAVAIGSAEGSSIVWRKIGPGCEWAPVAELERAEAIVLAPQLGGDAITRSLAVAEERDPDRSRALIWALPDVVDAELGNGDRIESEILLEQVGRRFTALSFIDDRLLAGASERIPDPDNPDKETRIYVLDRTRPGVYLSVPVEFFAEGRTVLELITLAVPSEAAGPELLIAAVNRDGRAELIRLGIAADAWDSFVRAGPVEPGVAGQIISLTDEDLDAEILVEVDKLYGVSVAAGSLLYAAADGLHPSELVHMNLDTRERRRLTDNRVRDYMPRLGPDGRYATYVSLMQVNISITPFSVPRVLVVNAQKPTP